MSEVIYFISDHPFNNRRFKKTHLIWLNFFMHKKISYAQTLYHFINIWIYITILGLNDWNNYIVIEIPITKYTLSFPCSEYFIWGKFLFKNIYFNESMIRKKGFLKYTSCSNPIEQIKILQTITKENNYD